MSEYPNPAAANQAHVIPPEAQRIFDVVSNYHDTIQAAYGMDITETDEEFAVWVEAAEIGSAVETDPATALTRNQHNLLAGAEAHAAALQTAMTFSEEQNGDLSAINDSELTGGIVYQMARERWDQYQAATEQGDKDRLRQEWHELKEYGSMIDKGEAGMSMPGVYSGQGHANILGVEASLESYRTGGEDPEAARKAHAEVKANAYFAKYATEIVARAPKSAESAPDPEFLDAIVRLGKDNTSLFTDVNGGFRFVGDGDKRSYMGSKIPGGFRDVYNRDHKPADWRSELNEFVMFSDVASENGQPVPIRNEATGQDEPTVQFRYNFDLRGNHSSLVSGSELPKYQEFRGHRNGQTVIAAVELPKSIASQLQAQIEQNPATARDLVEKLFLANNDGGLSEQDWFKGREGTGHPVRPPYEQLPADWTMAVVTSQETRHRSDALVRKYEVSRLPVAA